MRKILSFPKIDRTNLRSYLTWTLLILAAFAVYTIGIGSNPPGFYVDESGFAYTAHLVLQTGAGESGPRWPLFFQFYTGGFTQFTAPTLVYALAGVFWLFGPSILTARLFTALCMFAASLLLGALGAKVSGRRAVGVIVSLSALLTPWLFEVGRLVLDTFFYPMAVVLFLWTVYCAQKKDRWTWVNILAIVLTLVLLTYSYTIGRLLAPILAFGLICFATTRQRIFAVAKTWLLFAVTLVPLIVFIAQHPGFTTRFYLLSYIKPQSTWGEIILRFLARYFEDINPLKLLLRGDINPRHHIPDALGSFYIAAFVLAMIGIVAVIVRYRRDPWWWFVIYGLAASIVPGALTVDPAHTLRMIATPVFLLFLMVPAIEWLIDDVHRLQVGGEDKAQNDRPRGVLIRVRRGFLAVLLAGLFIEAAYFHIQFFDKGARRGYVFDAAYKPLYDEAVAQPVRPIFLVDGYWGPAYIHSLWYATVEGRSTAEFVHQPYGTPVPNGFIVISTEQNCNGCAVIRRNGDYLLYKSTR